MRRGFCMTFGKTTFLAPRVEVGVTVENVEVQKESACFEWTELLRGSVFVAQPRREEVRTQVLGAQERRCICRGWYRYQEGSALPCQDGL